MGHAHGAIVLRAGERAIRDLASPPNCPRCGAPMYAQRAGRGLRSGMRFWGCSNFWRGRCSMIIDIDVDGQWQLPLRDDLLPTGIPVPIYGMKGAGKSMTSQMIMPSRQQVLIEPLVEQATEEKIQKIGPDQIVTVVIRGKNVKVKASMVFLLIEDETNYRLYLGSEQITEDRLP